MKVVIDISHNLFESLVKGYDLSELGHHELYKAVQNGTPLPEHCGRLLILDEERVNDYSVKLGDWSCQKWINEVGISNSVVTIIPATNEKKCDSCMHKNDDFDCHNFCVPYDFDHYKPATKEGDDECIVTDEVVNILCRDCKHHSEDGCYACHYEPATKEGDGE